ncbi:MAG: hypothetical protein GY855_17020, partial [candidate division Zixibacteria bacterium]|nr:hypothetical protein [candidate division Zixibacteria bacterium]
MDKVLLIAEKHFGDALKNIISDRIVVTHLTYKEWRKKGFLSKISTLLRFKYIHHLGGTTSTTLIKSCRLLNKKLIIHFIGTDVYNILRAEMKDQHKIKKLYAKVWKLAAFGINLIEELKSVNIDNVEHIPFSANLKIPSETNKTPENSAITYLPEGSEEFYGWEFVKPLILKY